MIKADISCKSYDKDTRAWTTEGCLASSFDIIFRLYHLGALMTGDIHRNQTVWFCIPCTQENHNKEASKDPSDKRKKKNDLLSLFCLDGSCLTEWFVMSFMLTFLRGAPVAEGVQIACLIHWFEDPCWTISIVYVLCTCLLNKIRNLVLQSITLSKRFIFLFFTYRLQNIPDLTDCTVNAGIYPSFLVGFLFLLIQ